MNLPITNTIFLGRSNCMNYETLGLVQLFILHKVTDNILFQLLCIALIDYFELHLLNKQRELLDRFILNVFELKA